MTASVKYRAATTGSPRLRCRSAKSFITGTASPAVAPPRIQPSTVPGSMRLTPSAFSASVICDFTHNSATDFGEFTVFDDVLRYPVTLPPPHAIFGHTHALLHAGLGFGGFQRSGPPRDAFDALGGGRFDHYQFTWTAYLENGGTLEKAQMMAAHESPRTTKLYDRTADQITLDEVERIAI